MAYGWRGEGLSSEGEPERMRFAGGADSIGRTYQDDSERSSRRKANEAETGWSQPAHKLQTRPPGKGPAPRISMSHLVPLLEFNRNHLRSSIMTGISERQSLTREEKFVALVHIYAELRLPFDAALDAAKADLLRRPERDRTAVRDEP
jgi:hypothetical protein